MEYYNEETILYHNGEFIKASEARVDFYSQSLHYGYAVFEGIRSYKTISGETKIFKEKEHFQRLKDSADSINIPLLYTQDELIEASYEILRKNDLQDAYIRPLVYAPANMTFGKNPDSSITIAVWKMAPFLGDKLLRIMTSSFQRPNPKGFKIDAKAVGHYVNSILASHEAKENGFDEALLNDINGYVAEGTGANVFFEKDGRLFTPPPGNILAGITRATVIELCRKFEIPLEEKLFKSDELKEADTAFFCGTAAEIIGWESLDGVEFKKPWSDSLGSVLQQAYKNLVIEKPLREIETRFRESRKNKEEFVTG